MDLINLLNQTHILENLLFFFRSNLGAVFFIPIYACWTILLLPGLWLSLLAGIIYGPWLGSIFVLIGAFCGAQVSFLLARTFLRGWLRERLDRFPKLQIIEKSVSQEGLKLIFLSRLSPAFPFSLLNFAYGLSDVSFVDYSIGLLGIIPGTILFCNLGAVAGDIISLQDVLSGRIDTMSWIIRILGIFSTIAVVWLITKAFIRAVQNMD